MAVPKKRKSKSKTKSRKTLWKRKGFKQLTQIFSKMQLTKTKRFNSSDNKIEDDQNND